MRLDRGAVGRNKRSALRRSRAKGGRRLDAATSSAVFETKRRNALRLLRLTANF